MFENAGEITQIKELKIKYNSLLNIHKNADRFYQNIDELYNLVLAWRTTCQKAKKNTLTDLRIFIRDKLQDNNEDTIVKIANYFINHLETYNIHEKLYKIIEKARDDAKEKLLLLLHDMDKINRQIILARSKKRRWSSRGLRGGKRKFTKRALRKF